MKSEMSTFEAIEESEKVIKTIVNMVLLHFTPSLIICINKKSLWKRKKMTSPQ